MTFRLPLEQPLFRMLLLLLTLPALILTGCGHSSSGSPLPQTPSAGSAGTSRTAQALSSGDLVAINVGGAATGSFAADTDGQGGTATSVTDTINTSAANAAPAAVYQSQRYGPMTYTIPGLTAGSQYVVRLHFAETWFGLGGRPGTGQRLFNVAANGTRELTNFDVYAAGGAADTAVVRSFTVAANSSGQIVIGLTNGSANNAILNGIEVLNAPLTAATAINVGGPAVGSFAADVDGLGGALSSTTDIINVSAANAAPAAVYQTQRYGPMTYQVPGFTPGDAYTVRLHFAELYWGADGHPGGAGSRKFNVAINGTSVLSNFDVYAAAGGSDKALVVANAANADANGTFIITLTNGSADNAMLSAIEIVQSATTNTAASADAAAVNIGGAAAGAFAADTLANGGTNGSISTTTSAINVSATNAATQAVYQSQRFGAMQRTIGGLTPGTSYTVRLHFAELYWGVGRVGVGQRQFNVAINGTPVLSNFDVLATAGGPNIAVVRDFSAVSDGNGNITLSLTNGAADNPMLSGVEIIPGAPVVAVTGSETPRMSDAFVDSAGVNVHLSEYGSLYGNNFSTVQSLLQNLGVRHVRDGTTPNNAAICNEDVSLASNGIHFDVITPTSAATLAAWLGCIGPAAESLEGLNEYDLSGDSNWVADLTANTQAVASTYPQLPLVAPALTSEGAYQALGSLSNIAAFGNVHAYFAGRNPGTTGWGSADAYGVYGSLAWNLGVAGIVGGNHPVYVTESGYSDQIDQYAVPAVTKARYTLRLYLDDWNAGVPHTYLYELADEGTAPFSHYGIVDSSGNAKPAYTGLANLIAHLADKGGSFTPAPLNYNFTASSTVAHTLLQKRNGTYELIFWNEVPEWDPNANAAIATTPQVVQLAFGKAPTSIQQTTFADSGAVSTAPVTTGTSIFLSASAWPTIVDITP